MWRNDRDRPDDPRTRERETQRLARDEYDRPRYGSPPNDVGAGPGPGWDRSARDPGRPAPHGEPSAWSQGARAPRGGQHAANEGHGAPAPHQRTRNVEDVRVHELMTRRVTNVHPATSVERAARLMEECDCGALPVVGDNGVLVGMITDRDIAIRIVARGRDARNAIVADCMTERVFACYENESVTECMRQMAHQQIRRMPIVDDRGRLLGIIAQGDLARHAGNHPSPDERRVLTETVCAVSQPPHMPYR
jgi:CBS domain-containing protein